MKGNMVAEETTTNGPAASSEHDNKEMTINENGVDSPQINKKSRPTPESVAMDRGVQNIARKAHKNNKGDDKKLGINLLTYFCFTSFILLHFIFLLEFSIGYRDKFSLSNINTKFSNTSFRVCCLFYNVYIQNQ